MKETIEDLAHAVAEGFRNTATKQDLSQLGAELRAEMATKNDIKRLETSIVHIENRMTHIDDVLIADHTVRIKRLEGIVSAS